jgi:hypothetical protein
MKTRVATLVLLLAAVATPASAASGEEASAAADSAAISSLDLDVSGGALLEIPATTFT